MGLLQELNERLLEADTNITNRIKQAVSRALSELSEDELFYSAYSMYRGEGGQKNMISFIAEEYGEEFANDYSRALQALGRLNDLL